MQSSSEATGETEKEIVQLDKSSSDDTNISCNAVLDSQHIDSDYGPVDSAHRAALLNEDLNSSAQIISESSSWPCLVSLDNNEDEDSSTMSLRSDNSYVPFSMDDEFVAAIRNELREKLPQAQMSVIEAQELRDDDEPSIVSDVDSKNWDDELEDELADRTGVVDISIRCVLIKKSFKAVWFAWTFLHIRISVSHVYHKTDESSVFSCYAGIIPLERH